MVPPLCGWIAVTHIHARVLALESSCARRPATRFCGATNLGSALSAKWWLSEMLVRARNAPLHVYFAAPPRNTIRAHPARLPHSQAPAPEACLCLSFKVSWRFARWKLLSWSIQNSRFRSVYPATFYRFGETTPFRGRGPKLRTFSLSEVSIPWPLIPCGQLTQLKTTHLRSVSSHSTPVSNDSNQLLDLLVNSFRFGSPRP